MTKVGFFFRPRIEVTPNPALVDEPIEIKLTGFYPNQLVTVRAKAEKVFMLAPSSVNLNARWESRATFLADKEGKVDLATAQPMFGSYPDPDPMGLFWSMTMARSFPNWNWNNNSLPEYLPNTTETTLRAEVNGFIIATTKLNRLYYSPQVKVRQVTEEGLIGKLFYTEETEKKPGIIVLGGAEGGLRSSQHFAALLASRGFTVLALAYFGLGNLPSYISKIPLEYFQKAIDWMEKQESVDEKRIGVLGYSKGGELALLLASMFSRIKAVVAYTPSGVVFQGIGESWPLAEESAWTYQGKELPYIKYSYPVIPFVSFQKEVSLTNPLSLEHLYIANLQYKEPVERASIRVENINGPVLLITGDEDTVWPSTLLTERVVDRLAHKKFSHFFQHQNYKGVGHIITFPHVPTTLNIWCGGNPEDNAYANHQSWQKVLDFLKKSL